jgi:hypothetical protein
MLAVAHGRKPQSCSSTECATPRTAEALSRRYCFLAVDEEFTGFGWLTENCDRLPAGFAFACFGFFFSRLLLS